MVEGMLRNELALRHWGKAGSELDMMRLSVYAAAQQQPFGTSICGFRPTVHELHFNIASSTASIIAAIFWAIVFA